MANTQQRLTTPRYEVRKTKADRAFTDGFHSWLEGVDAEKIRVERPITLRRLASGSGLDSDMADRKPNSALVIDLGHLCTSYLLRSLRAYAQMLGEKEIPALQATANLMEYVTAAQEETHRRKWCFGLRHLYQIRGLTAASLPNLWPIIEDSVRDLVQNDLPFDIELGRHRAPLGRQEDKRTDRHALVVGFKARMWQDGYKVSDRHIWRSVGHTTSRQFYYWKKGQDCKKGDTKGATNADNRNFRRVLAFDTDHFLKVLADRRISLNKGRPPSNSKRSENKG